MTVTLSKRTLLTALAGLGGMASLGAWNGPGWSDDAPSDHVQILSPDPLWNLFAATPIALNRQSGAYTASFRPDVASLAGRRIAVMGFVLPLEAARTTTHFGLMRKNHQCDFCPPSLPTEAIEVRLTRPRPNTTDLVRISGVLSLHPSSDDGFFFQLAQATDAG